MTVLSTHGLSQTAARFQLRTKAPFLEIALPPNSTLWSAMVGDQPASPQRDKDRLLISLPSAGVDDLRDLKLVYETPVATWTRWGQVEIDAPRLMLRDESGTNRAEVPLADLQWHLVLPDGQRVVHSGGSVFIEKSSAPRSPAVVAAKTAFGIFSLPPVQMAKSARTTAESVFYESEDRAGFVNKFSYREAAPQPMAAPAATEPVAPPMEGKPGRFRSEVCRCTASGESRNAPNRIVRHPSGAEGTGPSKRGGSTPARHSQ